MSKPTYEQAQLHLQLYEQRREPKLRQARDWFAQNYFPESFDDAMKIAAPGTEAGIYFGMVTGYWEQACALLIMAFCTKTCSSKPVVNFSCYGSGLSQWSPKDARSLCTNSSLLTLSKRQSAMKHGLKNAHRDISPPCGSS